MQVADPVVGAEGRRCHPPAARARGPRRPAPGSFRRWRLDRGGGPAETGTTVAVGEVIRSTTTSRVRGEQAAGVRRHDLLVARRRRGKTASTTRAPMRRGVMTAAPSGPRRSRACSITSSSPGRSVSESRHGGHAFGHVAHPTPRGTSRCRGTRPRPRAPPRSAGKPQRDRTGADPVSRVRAMPRRPAGRRPGRRRTRRDRGGGRRGSWPKSSTNAASMSRSVISGDLNDSLRRSSRSMITSSVRCRAQSYDHAMSPLRGRGATGPSPNSTKSGRLPAPPRGQPPDGPARVGRRRCGQLAARPRPVVAAGRGGGRRRRGHGGGRLPRQRAPPVIRRRPQARDAGSAASCSTSSQYNAVPPKP